MTGSNAEQIVHMGSMNGNKLHSACVVYVFRTLFAIMRLIQPMHLLSEVLGLPDARTFAEWTEFGCNLVRTFATPAFFSS